MTATSAPSSRPDLTVPKSMRAAVLFGPNDIRVVEKPVPEPGPGEVLVKVAMCGACGSDLRAWNKLIPGHGEYGKITPGHEWTGTVVELGPTVDELAVGDRVAIHAHHGCGRCENCLHGEYTACLNYGNREKGHRAVGMTADGGFAEFVIHHVNSLYRMPDHVSFEDAVLIMTAGTGLYGLDVTGGYIAGQSVAVWGPGPVGLMTIQACKALGADQVILLGTRAARLDWGCRLGADALVNVREENPTEAILRLTNGQGVDLAIETSGSLDAPQQCVEATRRGGKILILAFYSQPVTFDLSKMVREDVTMFTSRGEGGGNVKRALSLVAQGKMKAGELVTHHLPLDDIQAGFEMLKERRGDPMKVVFVP